MNEHLVIVANRGARGYGRLATAVSVLRDSAPTVTTLDAFDDEGLGEALATEPRPTVVAAGGDGTLGLLVERLRKGGVLDHVVLGLLPLGTGNDFARAVGIPLDPGEAAAAMLTGVPEALDLLVDDRGSVAVNAVHAGVGGLAAMRAVPLKPWLGRMAYAVGAATAGARSRGWNVRVEVDGESVVTGTALLVGLGNGSTIGGGTVLWPSARPDDGIMEVVVARAGGLASRLTLAASLRRGDPGTVRDVTVTRGRSVRIEGEAIPYNADGEVGPMATTRCWAVEHQAWRLIVPRPTAHGSSGPAGAGRSRRAVRDGAT